MNCPKCDGVLEAELLGGETKRVPSSPFRSGPNHDLLDSRIREVDRCPSCGGIWLDRGEMAKGLQEAALVEPPLRLMPSDNKAALLVQPAGVGCARCAHEMQTLQSAAVPEVHYEMCPRCHGVWFDKGELAKFARAGAAQRALLIDEFP